MRPVLFWVWSSPVPTHDFFVLLGALAGVAVFVHEARRRHMLDERLLWVLAGSLVCGAAAARLSALWRYAAVALAMAIGRWGCFFTELPGTPTTLPWAVRLDGVPRHPSFLYESAFQGAMFCGLWWWGRPHVRVPGDLFKIYLLAYAIFRFLVEFVRGNDVVWAGLTRPQLFLIPATAGLAVYFATRRVRGDHAALALHAGQP
ncbi:MAG: diacylglyceryl transferase [Gemmatimonadetes bacterium]|nr:MAG: diacylglyceryl transferase [Gemmatimonadota bacterium]